MRFGKQVISKSDQCVREGPFTSCRPLFTVVIRYFILLQLLFLFPPFSLFLSLSLSLSLSLTSLIHNMYDLHSSLSEKKYRCVSIERKRHTTGVVTAQYRARCSTYTVNKEYCSTFLLQNFTFNSLLCLCNALWNYYQFLHPFFSQCGWYSIYINWGKNSLLT